MEPTLLIDRHDAVTVLTFNRPRVLNALSTQLKNELASELRRSTQDDSVRAIIITGAGTAFCAGQDLNEAKDLDGPGAEEWVRDYQRLYEAVRAVRVPIIAAINGWAVGAGLQIALLADIRIGSEAARFAMPEIRDGIPAIFGLAFLSRIIGMSRAIDMVLTGDALNAEQALQAGLITRLAKADELLADALTLAQRLATHAPLATALDKEWAALLDDELFARTCEQAIGAQRAAFAAGDARRHMEAFLNAGRK